MTFLEALQWMSESENNVCECVGISYKMKDGKLYRTRSGKYPEPSYNAFNELNVMEWSKSEPAPEEVEVVAYVSDSGALYFAINGSKDHEHFSSLTNWRKVKVRFS